MFHTIFKHLHLSQVKEGKVTTMDAINELRKLMEGSPQKQEEQIQEKEKRFINAAAACLNSSTFQSTLMNYDPQKMLHFLQLPISEIKEKLGGEWAKMSDSDLRNFLYSIEKKVKKSSSLMDWK